MKKHGAKRISKFDATVEVVNIVFLSIIAVIILYPLIYVLSASFSDAMSVTSGKMFLWPVDLTLENYEEVFKNKNIVLGFRNSIIIMVSGTVINLLMTILAAYPLSRRDLWGHSVIMKLITFTMFFNGGLIPSYLLIGKTLGLMDNWLSLILPGAISVYNMIIARTYMQTSIPAEMLEAAQVDGCSDARYFFQMVLPLSKAMIAVIALYYAVGHWNGWFNAFIYLNDRGKYPLQLFLREILIANTFDPDSTMDPELLQKMRGMSDLLKYSLIMVSSAPVMLLYPFAQKYFIKGVMIGSLKG